MNKMLKALLVVFLIIVTIIVIYFSPIIFPNSTKLVTENKSFELIKLSSLAGNGKAQAEYISQGKNYIRSKEIEESAIDYYKKNRL